MLRSGSIRSARNRVTVLAGGTALAVTTAMFLHSPSASTAAAPTDLAGVMATVAQASSTAVSSADYYLKIDGIDGESMAKGHEKQIEIESFSWGVSNTADSTKAGAGRVGKPKFQDMSIAKMLDKASPLLMQAVASGKAIKTVTLYGVTTGEASGQTFMTITLSDVLVSSFSESGASGGGGAPQDSLSLNFTKITFDYKPQNPNGSLGAAVHGGWDLKANKAV